MFTKTTLSAALIALTLTGAAAPGPALASSRVSDSIRAQITDLLVAQGYEVRKVEREDGMFEAYVVKDGVLYELYLDGQFNIVRIKRK